MMPFGMEGWGDVFFDRLWPEWRRDIGEKWAPTIDLSEKDGKYILTAELPGLKRDDICLSVEDGVLTLSGRKESNREEKGEEYYVKETREGSFCRSFKLPKDIDVENAEATYKEGVLKVVLPHKEEPKGKRIEVK